jgi:hypothetical protein
LSVATAAADAAPSESNPSDLIQRRRTSMEMNIEMPIVGGCSVSECAYNNDSACHAKAITIGDGVRPGCDTFVDGGGIASTPDANAGVGACKVSDCRHNSDLECVADSIKVGIEQHSPNCMTYAPR